ncbi:MAG TPA: YciI family protein [Pseudonocardia sp.]|uniref:YciI family protein n=1 Tax=Pseudonocardia sp. TaxID=60912 RepID=UPI002C1CDB97|nr:YciI family protein [Pseudonocardia sp.]HTF46960.1 YciI family protein [Pseudonocardia sp.]
MKYLLLICGDENLELDAAAAAQLNEDTERWVEKTSGVRLEGHRLRPSTSATSIRVRGGQVLATDGPFAETKEQMGGFDILECDGLEQAIEIAAAHPVAQFGTVEVRGFWD